MTKKFISVPEVAEYLGFSVSAIRKWIRQGKIPFCRINGGIRFDMNKIETWTRKGSENAINN